MHFFVLLRCLQSKIQVGDSSTQEAANNFLNNCFSHLYILTEDFSHDRCQRLGNMLMTLKSLKVHGFQRTVLTQYFALSMREKPKIGLNRETPRADQKRIYQYELLLGGIQLLGAATSYWCYLHSAILLTQQLLIFPDSSKINLIDLCIEQMETIKLKLLCGFIVTVSVLLSSSVLLYSHLLKALLFPQLTILEDEKAVIFAV